jgi:fluoride ion exporter CrcB/FEX
MKPVLLVGHYLNFSLYIAGSVLLGLGATVLGYVIAK